MARKVLSLVWAQLQPQPRDPPTCRALDGAALPRLGEVQRGAVLGGGRHRCLAGQ